MSSPRPDASHTSGASDDLSPLRALPCELLVVDDEEFVRDAMALFLESEGCRVHTAANGVQALELADRHPIEAAVIDIRMPGMDGLTLLSELKSRHPDVEVLMATGFQSLDTAVEAMRRGACDYITKPITDLENDLLRFVIRAVERRRLRLCNRSLSHELQHALEQLGGVRGEWRRHLETLDALELFGSRALTSGTIEDLFDAAMATLPLLAEFRGATLRVEGITDSSVVRRTDPEIEPHAAPEARTIAKGSRWIDLRENQTKRVAFPLACPTAPASDPIPGWLIVEPTPEAPLRIVDRLILRTFGDQLILSIAALRGQLPRTIDGEESPSQTENSEAR